MNYVKIDFKSNVSNIKIEGGHLCYQSKDYILSIEDVNIGHEIYDAFFVADKWLLNGLDNSLYSFDINGDLLCLLNNNPISNVDRKMKKVMLSSFKKENSYKRTLLDANTLEVLTKQPAWLEINQNLLSNETLYYSQGRSKILSLDLIK